MEYFGGSKISKAHQDSYVPGQKIVSMNTFQEEHSSKSFKNLSLKNRMVIPKEDVLFIARPSPK